MQGKIIFGSDFSFTEVNNFTIFNRFIVKLKNPCGINGFLYYKVRLNII